MKAIRFHETGRPEVLKLEDVEDLEAGPGEALVKVHTAGVNFADTLLRRGAYLTVPRLPEIPGFEASGVVAAIGAGVDKRLAGQRVAVLAERAYAEYMKVEAGRLIPLPDPLSFDDGAAFPVQALTAYHMLYTMDRIDPGDSVLIHAAAGGVGLLAVQMAKLAGARVFGTTSSEQKAKLVKEMGADEVILYSKVDFAGEIERLTQGRGVRLVLDSVGKATLRGGLKSLAPFGHLISYGGASGPPEAIEVRSLYEKSLKVSAFWLMTLPRTPETAARGIQQVTEWISSGKLRLVVGLKLPLAEAAEAHRQMESRQTIGKILLTVR
jgi:NADPH:quinone reductase